MQLFSQYQDVKEKATHTHPSPVCPAAKARYAREPLALKVCTGRPTCVV